MEELAKCRLCGNVAKKTSIGEYCCGGDYGGCCLTLISFTPHEWNEINNERLAARMTVRYGKAMVEVGKLKKSLECKQDENNRMRELLTKSVDAIEHASKTGEVETVFIDLLNGF